VYCVRRDLLDGFAEGRAFSFERDVLMPAAMREPVLGYTATRGFIDIGVPEDYRRAQALFAVRARGTP
jgi:D-glycero-alpha-D-manno-heptose 1-phosphate guanylyltransferase